MPGPEDKGAMAEAAAADADVKDDDLLAAGADQDQDTDGDAAGDAGKDQNLDAKDKQGGDTEDGDAGDGDAGDKDGDDDKGAASDAVPDSPDGYEIKLPEGFEDVPKLTGAIRVFAHENKIPQEQLQKLADIYTSHVNGVLKDFYDARAEELAQLKQDWGSDYDTKFAEAKKGIGFLAKNVEGFGDFAKDSGLSKDPMIMRVSQFIGSLLKESKTLPSEGDGEKEMTKTKGGAPLLSYK